MPLIYSTSRLNWIIQEPKIIGIFTKRIDLDNVIGGLNQLLQELPGLVRFNKYWQWDRYAIHKVIRWLGPMRQMNSDSSYPTSLTVMIPLRRPARQFFVPCIRLFCSVFRLLCRRLRRLCRLLRRRIDSIASMDEGNGSIHEKASMNSLNGWIKCSTWIRIFNELNAVKQWRVRMNFPSSRGRLNVQIHY